MRSLVWYFLGAFYGMERGQENATMAAAASLLFPVRAVVDPLVSNLFWSPAKAGHGQEAGNTRAQRGA